MRHAVKGKQLNRDASGRRALFKNLMLALIEHGQIKTTAAKAKAIRSSFEKLVTKAKAGSIHDRRQIDQELNQRAAVNKLVDEIAPTIKRTSGYTRVTKLGNRRGDDASMVRLEIIDWKASFTPVEKKEAGKAVKDEGKESVKDSEKPASKATAPAAKAPAKVKQGTTAATTAKRIPQKRISGGK